MIACLRSAQFMYADGSGSIVVELRRHHDTTAQCDNKQFLVTRRMTRLPHVILSKAFGTYNEAVRYWDEQFKKVEDMGLVKRDIHIVGFHEEG